MRPRRRRPSHAAPKRRESLLKSRSTTIRYLLFMLAGVLLGSIGAVLCGTDSIPCKILINQLTAIPERTLWALTRERLLFMAILVLCLLIAARCLWGRGMIPAVPLLFGLGQGTGITFLLMLLGWNGLGYIFPAVLLPRVLQLAVLVLLCNLAHSSCTGLGKGENASSPATLWVISILLLMGFCILEQLLRAKMAAMIL